MKIISIILLTYFNMIPLSFDFSNRENDWYVLSDGVMGGLSIGKIANTDEGVVFYGSVSLENNGGFTSFRAPWNEYNLTEFKEVTIRYRSEGMRLAFVMETSQRFWIPNYKVGLSNSKDWITETFQLADFKQYRLGDPTGKLFTEDVKDEIIRIGFITNEKRAGDFKFESCSRGV